MLLHNPLPPYTEAPCIGYTQKNDELTDSDSGLLLTRLGYRHGEAGHEPSKVTLANKLLCPPRSQDLTGFPQ